MVAGTSLDAPQRRTACVSEMNSWISSSSFFARRRSRSVWSRSCKGKDMSKSAQSRRAWRSTQTHIDVGLDGLRG